MSDVNIEQQVANQPDPRIDALKMRFREKMRVLEALDAEEKLENAMLSPLKLDGRVIAGESC